MRAEDDQHHKSGRTRGEEQKQNPVPELDQHQGEALKTYNRTSKEQRNSRSIEELEKGALKKNKPVDHYRHINRKEAPKTKNRPPQNRTTAEARTRRKKS